MGFSLFGWVSKGDRKIKDLTPDELATEAINQFQRNGWGLLAGRLLYRGLELNPRHVPLLIGLMEYFTDKTLQKVPQGSGLFSGLVLDYAMSLSKQLSPAENQLLQPERTKLLWKWGLAKYNGEKVVQSAIDFKDSFKFEIDEINFMKTILSAKAGKSSQKAFEMAHIGLGLRCGAVVKKKEAFRTAQAYTEWLHQELSTLSRSLK